MADKAFIKGLNLLTALAESREPRSLTSLAQDLDLTKSNVHRMLTTLVEQGFAEQTGENRHYRPTLRLWELGAQILGRLDVVGVAREHMPHLAEGTGETVHLSALYGTEVVYLDKIEGTQAVRSYTQIGARAPAWCVATGKALLAFTPRAVDRIAPADFVAHTSRTLTDLEALRAALDHIREDGIAYNLGEWRADVFGAAAPIFDARGTAVAAIGISGPSLRLTEAALRDHTSLVLETGMTISRALGHTGGPGSTARPHQAAADISSAQSGVASE